MTPASRGQPAGWAGLAAIGVSLACFLLTALLGPSAMQPALPGSPGQPPYALDAHPSPYLVIGLVAAGVLAGGAGLGLCLYAVGRGWSYAPRRLLIAGLLAAAAFVLMPPVGSGDHLNYAAYGRMVVTGHDPYVTGARDLPDDPVADAVEPPWREEPSIYGPIATAQEAVASWIGGDSARLTVFVLSFTNALAFALVGLVLYRTGTPGGQLRAVLLWTANPLLLFHLVSGAHNDVLAIAAAVGALATFKASSLPRTLAAGALVGAAAAIKLPAALVGGGPAWAILRRARASVVAKRKITAKVVALGGGALVVAVVAYVLAGSHAFDQVRRASRSVSLATPWHLVDIALGKGAQRPIIQVGSLVLLVGLLWLLARALPGALSESGESHRIAAALVLAWLFATPYALPWYDALGWATLALLPWSVFDWVVLARTVALSLAYLPARDPQVVRLPENLSWLFTVVRSAVIPWAMTAILIALAGAAVWLRRADRRVPDLVPPPRG